MQPKNRRRYLLINGECEVGLFNTLDDVAAEINDGSDHPDNYGVYEVTAKYEVESDQLHFRAVPLKS